MRRLGFLIQPDAQSSQKKPAKQRSAGPASIR